MVWTPLVRHLRSDTRPPANSIANTAASSASPRYATSKRVGLLVLQRLATDSRAELDYVRMVGYPEVVQIVTCGSVPRSLSAVSEAPTSEDLSFRCAVKGRFRYSTKTSSLE